MNSLLCSWPRPPAQTRGPLTKWWNSHSRLASLPLGDLPPPISTVHQPWAHNWTLGEDSGATWVSKHPGWGMRGRQRGGQRGSPGFPS